MDEHFYRPQSTASMTNELEESTAAVSGYAYRVEGENVGIEGVDEDEGKVDDKDNSTHTVDVIMMRKKVIRRMDILKMVFDSMTGKDRIAKICKYVIDLLQLFFSRSRYVRNISDVKSCSELLSKGTILNVLKDPRLLLYAFASSVARLFNEKGALVSFQLGFYRQIMRCGGTPFRLYHWYNKLLEAFKDASCSPSLLTKSSIWMKVLCNEQSLEEFIGLYYGIMDELMLLYKLKLWSNKSMHRWVVKHEALSWYYDILLSLKQNWVKLQTINQREFELKIQCQVRQRALEMSARLNPMTQPVHSENYNDTLRENLLECFKQDITDLQNELISKLREFSFEKQIVKLDLSRLFFDFLADTTDVFSIRTPPGTYGALSLCSGTLGFIKLWIKAKNDLSNKI